LKRLRRYLRGEGRSIQNYKWQETPKTLTAFTDSDWAGDKPSRKPTSGGVVMWGKHMLKSWSSTQQVVARSSGEAELHALLKGATQAKGIMSMFLDWNIGNQCILKTDATAALGISHRMGLGRTRHIEVQYLWIQQEANNKELEIKKVSTHINPADVLTKFLKTDVSEKNLKTLGRRTCTSRAETALKINGVSVTDSWTRDERQWMRRHSKPRRCLFTPIKVPSGPVAVNEIGRIRITEGKFENGEEFEIVDDWRTFEERHDNLGRPWTGRTTFTEQRRPSIRCKSRPRGGVEIMTHLQLHCSMVDYVAILAQGYISL